MIEHDEAPMTRTAFMAVTEFVRATAKQGKADDLRAALEKAIPEFPKQQGCRGARAFQGVESEDSAVFFLVIEWDSVEAHLAWRDSDTESRRWFVENVRPFFEGTNLTGHFVQFVEG